MNEHYNKDLQCRHLLNVSVEWVGRSIISPARQTLHIIPGPSGRHPAPVTPSPPGYVGRRSRTMGIHDNNALSQAYRRHRSGQQTRLLKG
jgi:hypothetical protein